MRVNFCAAGVMTIAFLALPATVRAQGLFLPGGGAAHVSMGGASTATPVDAIGALYWNPAAIGRLGRSEVSIGGAFLYPNFYLDSTAPGPFGLRSGRTRSDSGVAPTSNVGVVYQPEESPLTYGLALNTLGGGGVNFPGDVGIPSGHGGPVVAWPGTTVRRVTLTSRLRVPCHVRKPHHPHPQAVARLPRLDSHDRHGGCFPFPHRGLPPASRDMAFPRGRLSP